MFYPAETVQGSDTGNHENTFALLEKDRDVAVIDPIQDVFLREHCLDQRPLLPMVIGLELLVEAACRHRNLRPIQFGGPKLYIKNFESIRGFRFFGDEAKEVQLVVNAPLAQSHQGGIAASGNGGGGEGLPMSSSLHVLSSVTLKSDFTARNGKLVEAGRCYMQAEVGEADVERLLDWKTSEPSKLQWTDAKYPPNDAAFFVGPAFRVLKQVAVDGRNGYGIIQAPSLIELAGNRRDVTGWRTPSAILDACLFATGVLAWNHIRPGINLPVGFREILLHRMPKPGESCRLETRCVRFDDRTAEFNFCLWGSNGEVVVEAVGYFTAWLEMGSDR